MKLYLLLFCLLLGACQTVNPDPDMHIIPTAPESTQTTPESTQTSLEPTQTAPEYTHAIPIPLKVGVLLDDSLISNSYGLVVIKEWEKMQLFDSLVYPYQENDPVDIVMRLSVISGGDMGEVVERELENENGYVVKEVVEETLLKMRRMLLTVNVKEEGEKGFNVDEDYRPKSYSDEDVLEGGKEVITDTEDDWEKSDRPDIRGGNEDYHPKKYSNEEVLRALAVPTLFFIPPVGAQLFTEIFFFYLEELHGEYKERKLFPYDHETKLFAQGTTFTHDALAVINQSSDEIGQYSVQVATTIQLGNKLLKDAHGRNYVEGYDAGYELQGKRLAFELAKKIRADRQNLLSKLGKSQEETTTP